MAKVIDEFLEDLAINLDYEEEAKTEGYRVMGINLSFGD